MGNENKQELKIDPDELGGQEINTDQEEHIGRSKVHRALTNAWAWVKSLLKRNRGEDMPPVFDNEWDGVVIPQTVVEVQRQRRPVAFNWLGILAFVLLVNMAKSGMVDTMPELKWLIESMMRLLEALLGLLHDFLEWAFQQPKIGLLEPFLEWASQIFGI